MYSTFVDVCSCLKVYLSVPFFRDTCFFVEIFLFMVLPKTFGYSLALKSEVKVTCLNKCQR